MRTTLPSLAAVVLLTACLSPPPDDTPPQSVPAPVTVELHDVTEGEQTQPAPTPPTAEQLNAMIASGAVEEVPAEPPPAGPHVDPENLGPSYREKAEAALGASDWPAAEDHYLAWLAADPGDANSWYNLACVQALQGKQEPAMLSFQASLAAGFDQLEHARRDGDLESLRDDPRFEEALAAAEERAKAGDVPDMERHVLGAASMGTYVALLPPDYATSERSYPVCIVLHGSGSSETGHARVSAPLGREGVIYLAPRALQAHVGATIASGRAGWTVWPPEAPSEASELNPMALHVEWVFACLDDAMERYRIDPDRVAIWGHSQGAAGALSCAARHPDRVHAVCAYAGYYPVEEITDARIAAMIENGVAIHLAHARDDRVVEPKTTEELETRLREARAAFHVAWFDNGGHGLFPDVVEWSKRWLRDFVDGAR
jgi:predicted esterase